MARCRRCTMFCSLNALMLIAATGLTAAGLATNYWYNGNGLYDGFDLDNPGADDKEVAVRACGIITLGLAAALIQTYFTRCCCPPRRLCVCIQTILLIMTTAASAGLTVVFAWSMDWETSRLGYSFYFAAAGGIIYFLSLLFNLSECCCGDYEDDDDDERV